MSLRPVLHVASRPSRSEQVPLSTVAPHPSIESNALLRGTREVLIRHGGEVYRLRHTRNDKLILTK
ncbi:MAG TPA: hemin uptake protein HemP [Lysobacter sp.]|jgi:hemin uptake protein HemP|nr:hemin uptake protein HemP [Lysobacter sp.]